MKLIKIVCIALAATLAVALAYRYRYGRETHPSAVSLLTLRDEPRTVVMIVADTLRADYLPFYGHPRDTAPFLSSLMSNAVVFDRAYSASSSTAPAMASVFTSLYPSSHGVVTGLITQRSLAKRGHSIKLNRIPDHLTTLGSMLSAAKYRAFGVSDNPNISPDLGFVRGFERFETFRYRGAPEVNKVAMTWPKEDGRTFYYVHYMDPHEPYHERAPWYEPAETREERMRRAYESEIRYMDEHIRALFEHFGWRENALVVFLSDHGEELGDHGQFGHGKTLYSEVTRVPLFIYRAGLAPARIHDTVQTLDLLPTLAEIIGIEPEAVWQGRSLFTGAAYGRPVFSELLRHETHRRASWESVVFKNHQFLVWGRDGERNHELYDLSTDFEQKNNLAATGNPLESELIVTLESRPVAESAKGQETTIKMDREAIENLRTLGYIQ